MIENIVVKLVDQMVEENLISRDDSEHYEYAMVTLAERMLTIGTLLIIGLICGNCVFTLCFLGAFLSLRKRTGGYHTEYFWQCYLLTIGSYVIATRLAVVFLAKPMLMYLFLTGAVIVIEIIGTVNHPNMDMDEDELREAKKAARLVTLLELLVIGIFVALEIDKIYVASMSIAIISCAFSLCIAKIIKQEV